MSFLTRHITNPVYLMAMRRLNRSWIIPITLFITLFFTFIFPVLIYIADFQWNYTGSNPRGARGAFAEKAYELLLMFHMWIPFAWCLLFPLTVAHGYHTPQREFTHHGKLQPKTLLDGGAQGRLDLAGFNFSGVRADADLPDLPAWRRRFFFHACHGDIPDD